MCRSYINPLTANDALPNYPLTAEAVNAVEEMGWRHKKRVLKEEDRRVDFGVYTRTHQIWRLVDWTFPLGVGAATSCLFNDILSKLRLPW